MSLLRPKTLDGKLKTVVVITTTVALVLSSVAVAAYQFVTARERLIREMETLTDVVGTNGQAALAFLVSEDAGNILSSVEAKPEVTAGYFFTAEDELLAAYVKKGTLEAPACDSGHAFVGGALATCRDVFRDDEKIGKIILVSTLEPLERQLRGSVSAIAIIFSVCALLALAVGYRWLWFISQPIASLVSTAAGVSERRDYSLRAVKYEDDELGHLTDRFNHMLEQIERSDRELQHANQELARSNSDLERFAYVASHDLQEPLRIVISYSELLADDLGEDLEPNPRKYLGYVVSASKRMKTMIEALLDYSRVGTRERRFAPADCNRALDAALANLHLVVEESGVRVTRGELPTVVGDLHQLTQLFQNLVANALKFHREGVVATLDVSCNAGETAWELCVADNGIGMDPESTDRIFDVFQRLHSRSEYPGTGIGLAICRRIVERHDGEIRVESTPGEGSKFFFKLPIRSKEAVT